MSTGVEWAIHCCVVMSRAAGPVATPKLAELHGVSRSYLAKNLQQLAKAGLITPAEGRDGGYALATDPAQITVLDVVLAIEGRERAFRCTEIRQNGPFPASAESCRRPCGVSRVIHAAEDAWRDALRHVTIADLAATVEHDSGPDAFTTLRDWLQPQPSTGA